MRTPLTQDQINEIAGFAKAKFDASAIFVNLFGSNYTISVDDNLRVTVIFSIDLYIEKTSFVPRSLFKTVSTKMVINRNSDYSFYSAYSVAVGMTELEYFKKLNKFFNVKIPTMQIAQEINENTERLINQNNTSEE